MPQWSLDRKAAAKKYPDQRALAVAPVAHQRLLRRYDHHVVQIGGRPALLLTYEWDTIVRPPNTEWPFEVSFTYAAGHPVAPAEVQSVVDSLAFVPIEDTPTR